MYYIWVHWTLHNRDWNGCVVGKNRRQGQTSRWSVKQPSRSHTKLLVHDEPNCSKVKMRVLGAILRSIIKSHNNKCSWFRRFLETNHCLKKIMSWDISEILSSIHQTINVSQSIIIVVPVVNPKRFRVCLYRSGTANSNTVNSNFHLIRTFC